MGASLAGYARAQSGQERVASDLDRQEIELRSQEIEMRRAGLRLKAGCLMIVGALVGIPLLVICVIVLWGMVLSLTGH